MLHNGSMRSDQYGMTSSNNAFGPANSVMNNHVTQQNGSSYPYQDANMNSHSKVFPQLEPYHMTEFGGGPSKLGALLSDRSQVQISSSQKDPLHTTTSNVQNKDEAEFFDDEFEEAEDLDGEDSDDLCKIDEVYTETIDEEMSPPRGRVNNKQERQTANRLESVPPSESIKGSGFNNCNGRVEYKKFTPNSPIDVVRNLLDGVTNGGETVKKRQSLKKPRESIDDVDLYSDLEDHIESQGLGKQQNNIDDVDMYAGLDDEGLDSGFQSRFSGKTRDGLPTARASMHFSESERSAAGANSVMQNKYDSKNLSEHLASMGSAKSSYIPMKSVKTAAASELQNKVHVSPVAGRQSVGISSSADHLSARMDHEGGFIQIGPAGDPAEESFEFSVTILFAKNLEQLLPQDFMWSPNSGTCFSYSLMGCMITSAPIKNLYNPDFLVERVAGNIKSTPSNLHAYFKKHPDFPIHLLLGDLCLASTSISLSKFQDFDCRVINQIPLCVEGWHQLISVLPESAEIVPGKEPAIDIIIQLSGQSLKTSQHIPLTLPNSDSSDSEVELNQYAQHHRRRHRGGKLKYHNSVYDTASVSSVSSDDDLLPAGKKRRGLHPRKLHHKEQSLLSELNTLRELSDDGNKLRSHLFKAALEIESWKEDQQALFLKQWSAREADLQRHLSDEWRSRIISIESSLQSRLAQSDALNRKLTAALSELSIREKKLSVKEERVRKLLGELETKKHEQDEAEKQTFEGRLKQQERKENNALLEELVKEKEKNEQLESEVCELKSNLALVEMPPHLQYHELKKQIVSLKGEKESMSDELSAALRKKQYYKVQWIKSISQLHHLKKSHLYDIGALRNEMEMSSPEPLFVHPQPHRRHRPRSHTIDGSLRMSKRSMKPLESQRMKETGEPEPSCSWMDKPPPSQESRHRTESSRVSGISRNRTEHERTLDVGKVRRTSIGSATNEYEEFLRRRSTEEHFDKLMESNVWKVGEK